MQSNKIHLIVALLLIMSFATKAADKYFLNTTGDSKWSTEGNWNPSKPGADDIAIITTPNLIIDEDIEVSGLTIINATVDVLSGVDIAISGALNNGGILNLNGENVIVGGNVTNDHFIYGNSGSINVGGDWTNNGNFYGTKAIIKIDGDLDNTNGKFKSDSTPQVKGNIKGEIDVPPGVPLSNYGILLCVFGIVVFGYVKFRMV